MTRLVEWALYYSVRGGGKNPLTFGLGIFAPTLNLVVS